MLNVLIAGFCSARRSCHKQAFTYVSAPPQALSAPPAQCAVLCGARFLPQFPPRLRFSIPYPIHGYAICGYCQAFVLLLKGGHGLNSSLGIFVAGVPRGAAFCGVWGQPCPALPVQIEGFHVVGRSALLLCADTRALPADARSLCSVTPRPTLLSPTPIAGDFVQGLP